MRSPSAKFAVRPFVVRQIWSLATALNEIWRRANTLHQIWPRTNKCVPPAPNLPTNRSWCAKFGAPNLVTSSQWTPARAR